MRYFALALAALGSLSATLASTTTPTEHITERGVSPNPAYAFEKRQGANAVFCANVNVNFPRTVDGICALPALGTACNGISGLTVRSTLTSVISILNLTPNPLVRICLCVDATGQLTAGSVANLRTALGIQVTNVAGVNNLLQQILPTLDLTALVGPIAASLVPQAAASCVYPANSTPACSTVACDFVCNTAAFPQKCNRSCIAANAVCATGNPTRRRRTVSNDLLCSKGRSACAIPGNKYGFECLDTTTDVNSCGGCAFPLPGALKGQDCSTIPHTANVDCVGGKCIVSTCRRGFELDDNKCVEKASIAAIVEEATHAAGGLAHVVADRLVLQNAKKSIQARQVTAEQLRAQARAKRANKQH